MERSMNVTEEEALAEKQLLRPHRRIAYALGNFLTVLAIAVWFPYNVTFFQFVVGLSAKSAGNIVLIAQIGGALSTPFVGMWSDQCSCRVPGRRKIFHLIGIITLACVMFFLWYKCLGCSHASEAYQVLYFCCFAIVFQFSWASIQIGQLALLPEISAQKRTQVQLNSLRYSFTIIANLIVFGCFWLLLKFYSNNEVTNGDQPLAPDDLNIFLVMSAIVIGLGVPSSLLLQFFIPEKANVNLAKLVWYKWIVNPKFYLTALCLIGARIIVLVPQTYMPHYFTITLKMTKSSIALGPLILYISSFVATLIVKKCRGFIGDNMTYFIGMAVVWCSVMIFWTKSPTNDTLSHFNWSRDYIYIGNVLLGIGGAMTVVIGLSRISFLVGKFKGSSAFVYGWILFVDRISNGIIVSVIQHLVPSSDGDDSEILQNYYRNVMVYVPFFASGLGLTVTLAFLIIDRKSKKLSKIRARTLSKLGSPINYGPGSETTSIASVDINEDEDDETDDDLQRFTETL